MPLVARFSAPVQAVPGAHPASRSFPVVKRQERGVDHPPLSNAEVKERVELYLYSPLWVFVAYSRVTFTFTFYVIVITAVSARTYKTARHFALTKYKAPENSEF
jgi:hypothetical protein